VTGAPDGLFRAEAVAYHERGLGPGNLLRHARWVPWAFWSMLLAVVAALAATVIIQVSPTLTGPLRLDPTTGRTTMLVSASGHPGLDAGLAVTTSDGRRGRVDDVQPAGSTNVLTGAEVLVDVGLAPPGREGDIAGTTATVHLPSQSLAVFVFPGLHRLLGD
jgi:hypothetical protein